MSVSSIFALHKLKVNLRHTYNFAYLRRRHVGQELIMIFLMNHVLKSEGFYIYCDIFVQVGNHKIFYFFGIGIQLIPGAKKLLGPGIRISYFEPRIIHNDMKKSFMSSILVRCDSSQIMRPFLSKRNAIP